MRRVVLGLALFVAGCSTPPASPPDASTGQDESPRVGAEGGAATAAPERGTSAPEIDDQSDAPDASQKFEIAVGDDACETDADCVKTECCHPTACGSADKAPSCGDVACTLDCRVGTADCFGGCLCQEGKCAARLWMGPADG